ncbi:MAG: Xaa-Pro dipeptidase [Gammaproteobacteria bacterium]|nr:Xaa-Pro dipeptidase [Gammaproteobacteria bacterium]
MDQTLRSDSRAADDRLAPLYAEHAAILTARFEDALEAAGLDGVCIFSGRELTVARDDSTYPFKAEPYFKAWVPLTRAPGSVIAFRPGERPSLIYLQPEDFWHAPPADPAGFWVEHFDVTLARSEQDVRRALTALDGRLGAIGDPAGAADLFASVDDRALLNPLDFARARKSAYEVECLAGASAMAARGHLAAAQAFLGGATEFELHQHFCTAAGQRESELPYNAIVALDRHAAVLHYQHLAMEPPERGASFLIDAGTQKSGYASDVTRTWSRHAGEFRDLIASMESLQQTICGEVRGGVDFVALNERAHELLAGVLAEHGIVKCGAAEAHARGLTRVFLPHGLGHLLGLQVHDAGGRQAEPAGGERPAPPEHPYLRLTRTLETDFVVTIEPGLYFIPSLLRTMAAPDRAGVDWDAVERLLPYGGIRIEDDVVVQAGGCRNLTREAFATA